ncbi:DnaJ domain-containing protein [bacterium]|nr:DnaJ domain-containing protein [bacterium]MBU1634594.1 DnaJ domain-containing protein [bacterium]
MRQKFVDYYSILSISSRASIKTIQRHFENTIKDCYIESNVSIEREEEFIEIFTAYQILTDAEKRNIYDIIRNHILFNDKEYSEEMFNMYNKKYLHWQNNAKYKSIKYIDLDYDEFARDILGHKITINQIFVTNNTVNVYRDLSVSAISLLGIIGIIAIGGIIVPIIFFAVSVFWPLTILIGIISLIAFIVNNFKAILTGLRQL